MLPELTRRLLRDWRSHFPGQRQPRTIDYLSIPGAPEGGTTTFLAFADQSSRPAVAVKVHRRGGGERARQEAQMLQHLRHCGGSVASRVPEVVLCDQLSGVWVLAQKTLQGTPMPASLTSDGTPDLRQAERHFAQASQWLLDLRRSTRSAQIELPSAVAAARATIQKFAERFPTSAQEDELLALLDSKLDTLLSGPPYVQHGDFTRHNLLIDASSPEQLSVLDWTDSTRLGAPLDDLFFFVTTYLLQIRKVPGLEGFARTFEDTFFETTPYGECVDRCLLHHCTQLGLAPESLEDRLGLFLVRRSVLEADRIEEAMNHGIAPRFALRLTESLGLGVSDTPRAQFWHCFFKRLSSRKSAFSERLLRCVTRR